jgi:hypothetical protein
MELLVESAGEQLASVQLNMEDIIAEDNTLILKLVKRGSKYTALVSSDGKDFKEVGIAEVVLKDIQVGIFVNDGELPARYAGFRRFMQQGNQPEAPFEVAFDYFHIENTGLK